MLGFPSTWMVLEPPPPPTMTATAMMMTTPSARISRRLVSAATVASAACVSSYLIRRLSTALLGAGHQRVAVRVQVGQRVERAARNYGSLQDTFRLFSSFSSSLLPFSRPLAPPSSFLPSIQRRSGTFRSLALLLRSYSGSEGNLRPCEKKMDEGLSRQRCYECQRNQSLQRLGPQIPTPSFLYLFLSLFLLLRVRSELSIAAHGCFSHGELPRRMLRESGSTERTKNATAGNEKSRPRFHALF